VLAWGTDAYVVSFVSPHSLHARSLVLGRSHHVELRNATVDVPLQVIVDGHGEGTIEPGGAVSVRLSDRSARLARLPGTSFFSRYRDTFSH
jgi:NAD+ kinase